MSRAPQPCIVAASADIDLGFHIELLLARCFTVPDGGCGITYKLGFWCVLKDALF